MSARIAAASRPCRASEQYTDPVDIPVVPAVAEPDAPRFRRRLVVKPGRAGLWTALVPLLIPHVWIGVFLLWGAASELAGALLAEPVTGTIISLRQSTSSKGSTTSYVEAGCELPDGLWRGELVIDNDRYASLRTQQPIDLKYSPLPYFQQVWLAGEGANVYVFFFAAFWNAICGALLWTLAGKKVLTWWLMKRGALVSGEVVSISPPQNGKGDATVTFRFVPLGGGPAVEATAERSPVDARALGPRVQVAHAIGKPQRCAIVDDAPWQVVSGT